VLKKIRSENAGGRETWTLSYRASGNGKSTLVSWLNYRRRSHMKDGYRKRTEMNRSGSAFYCSIVMILIR
jgi:hypothetical protein